MRFQLKHTDHKDYVEYTMEQAPTGWGWKSEHHKGDFYFSSWTMALQDAMDQIANRAEAYDDFGNPRIQWEDEDFRREGYVDTEEMCERIRRAKL